jgi:hypothetical protein
MGELRMIPVVAVVWELPMIPVVVVREVLCRQFGAIMYPCARQRDHQCGGEHEPSQIWTKLTHFY